MNVDLGRIYYNAVLGGIGGLLGWAAVALVGAALPGMGVYVRDVILGLAVGVAIGAAVGSADGLVVSRSLRRWLQGALVGAALGAVGGVVGLVLGEILFGLAGGGVWPRALGWALFGGFVGAGDGVAQRMPSRVSYGAIGGVLGGLIGGSTYERLTVVLIGLWGDRAAALAWGGAVGLILLGAFIGALVGLVESLLRQAWLTFLSGRLEGQNRTLDPRQPRTTLGRSDLCSIVLFGDTSVANVHAEVTIRDGGFVMSALEGPVAVERDGNRAPAAASYALQAGDRIQLGATRMVFRAEEASQR